MERYIVRENPLSPIAESYRKIAANIKFANIDGNIKTIMGTSSLASEGKTTTICNVACVMAEANKTILLIDLDLRKPAVHKQFKISNKIGLTDMLLNKDGYKNYINNVFEGLDVITSGKIPGNPTELINSKSIRNLIAELSQYYDYILIDTPPILLVSDPMTIATYTDAVILTISHAEIEKELAKKTVSSLLRVKANIIGAVLNKVPVSKHNKYYYNYY